MSKNYYIFLEYEHCIHVMEGGFFHLLDNRTQEGFKQSYIQCHQYLMDWLNKCYQMEHPQNGVTNI